MKTSKFIIIIFLAITLLACCCGPDRENMHERRTGPYAGSPVPGESPELFAPGFITTGLYERDIAISPLDGKEIYFSIFLDGWATIMVTRENESGWTMPEVAPFARDTLVNFCEPAFTPDGEHLLFLCTQPLDGGEAKQGWEDQNIWMVSRDSNGGWGEKEPLPEEINSGDQFFPSIAGDGTFIFSRTDTASGISSVFMTTWPPYKGLNPARVPPPVQGPGTMFNACISPDGLCIVACAVGKDSLDPAKKAVYYSFFKEEGKWSEGIKLNDVLQLGDGNAISPSFSPDGKYFFFATTKGRGELSYSKGEMDLAFFQERRTMPGNGNSDIYWIDARAISGNK